MRSPGEDRAVSSQIGAVLLLAVFVLAFSQYQLDVVPEQNRQTEIDHNERVTGELIELRDSITAAGYQDGTRGTTATLGTQYGSRILALNPPQPSGTLRTGDANNVTIDGVDGETVRLASKPIVYEPDYNEYENAPTTRIEHTAVINVFADGVVTVEDPTLATDDAVVLPIVDGKLSRSTTGTVSVEIQTLETYRIGSLDEGGSIEFESAHPEVWNERDDWETVDGNVVEYAGDAEAVVIARVAVGDASARSATNDAIADYGEPFVTGGGSDPGEGDPFESVAVADVEAGSRGDVPQSFEIALADDLAPGEEIEIDLSGAQPVTHPPPNAEAEGVDYGSARAAVVDGSGSATLEVDEREGTAILTYAAGSGGDAAGDTIRIDVAEYAVEGDAGDEFEVAFATGDSVESDAFAITAAD